MADSFNPDFCWATGIENTFIPQIRPGFRALDEYTLTQHYQQWKSDIDLMAQTGVQAVRWGIPWYRVQPRPDQWDWAWVDQVLDYMVNVKGIIPILDLMHYGTPLWLDNSFINHRYPEAVAHYAAAVAARYKSLVRYYTPYNEPVLSAEWSGFRGDWPPYLNGDDGYVKVLLAIARGIICTVQALKAEQPMMQTVQVEAARHFWTRAVDWQPLVARLNEQQYLSLDLSLGRIDEAHPLYAFLSNLGVSEGELGWFRDHAVNFDFLGVNFYPWSYGELAVRKQGGLYRLPRQTNGAALGEVSARIYARYQLPLLITETSAKGSIARRTQWMDETVLAVHNLRHQGVPVMGYTWFPLFSMVDWIYRRGRRPLKEYLIHLGLYDSTFDVEGILRRHTTPLVARYQQHMGQSMPPVSQQSEEG
ncbi:family 1 glycosylhydrolase [soil metagenome]